MEIITKQDGKQVEVLTAEEIESQKQEAIEEYKVNNPDKSAELDALQEELKNQGEELAKLKTKDLNFANLRNQKEGAEAKIDKLTKDIDIKIDLAKKEVFEGVLKDHYNEVVKTFQEMMKK